MFRPENAQSLVGIALTLGICWALSDDRRRFPWKLALGAVAVQVALVLLLVFITINQVAGNLLLIVGTLLIMASPAVFLKCRRPRG